MSEPDAVIAAGLLGVAAAAGSLGIMILARPGHWRRDDPWRDPAPALFRLLMPLARALAERLSEPARGEHERLQQALARAGMGYALLAAELRVLRWLTGAVGVVGALSVMPALATSPLTGALLLAGAWLLGHAYPVIWLRDQARRRQQRIARQFPALLELLGLSVRAGISFSAALGQCTGYLEAGPLRVEMQRVSREIRTGLSRQAALERMAERVDLAAVQGFVAAIGQAEETGAAISQTLADQAAQRRRERFAAAEKKANEAPVRMLLPLVGLLFPMTFLIIGFPIAQQFITGGLL